MAVSNRCQDQCHIGQKLSFLYFWVRVSLENSLVSLRIVRII